MEIKNLSEIIISASDVKKELSEIMTQKITKVIVKNNNPMSVIMPYDEYVSINENIKEGQTKLHRTGQDIMLNNGVVCMIVPEVKENGDIAIKMYIKMKTSEEYKLHYTLNMNPPHIEQTLTAKELVKHYNGELEID